MSDDDRHAAWEELHAATPPGWSKVKSPRLVRAASGEVLTEELAPRRDEPAVDAADQLRKLAELRDAGIVTSEEFEAKKADPPSHVTEPQHAAWDELHAATPPGWFVGRAGQRHGGEWAMYAFDTSGNGSTGEAVTA